MSRSNRPAGRNTPLTLAEVDAFAVSIEASARAQLQYAIADSDPGDGRPVVASLSINVYVTPVGGIAADTNVLCLAAAPGANVVAQDTEALVATAVQDARTQLATFRRRR